MYPIVPSFTVPPSPLPKEDRPQIPTPPTDGDNEDAPIDAILQLITPIAPADVVPNIEVSTEMNNQSLPLATLSAQVGYPI